MAFCFDNRGAAAERLAERGGVNFRHHFIDACGDGRFAVYLTSGPVPEYRFKTVATPPEAFDFLERLDAGELGYVTRDHAGNWAMRSYDEAPVIARNRPLVWVEVEREDWHKMREWGREEYRYDVQADDGVGVYRIEYRLSIHSSGYVACYRSFMRAAHEHNRVYIPGKVPNDWPPQDVCRRGLSTLDAAKAACERHFTEGDWGEEPARADTPRADTKPRVVRGVLLGALLLSVLLLLIALLVRQRVAGT